MASSLPHEGEIHIYLKTGTNPDVQIQSSRPLQVSRLMLGKSPAEVSAIIPLLYNVCASAQSRASLLALQTTLQQPLDPAQEKARELLVTLENAREYLIRIFRDWPELFNETVNLNLLPDILGLLPQASASLFSNGKAFTWQNNLTINAQALDDILNRLSTIIEQQVFGIPPAKWLEIDSTFDLMEWAEQTDTLAARSILHINQLDWSAIGQSSVQALPRMDSEQLIEKLTMGSVERFIQSPRWAGKVCETSTYTRQQGHALVKSLTKDYGNGLLPRWIARLVELASIPAQLKDLTRAMSATEPTSEMYFPGLAQVETARGRLVHYAQVENQKITEYRILAPTEWNFHRQGLIKLALLDVLQQAPQSLNQAIRCVINIIDPCVGYQLKIN